MRQLSRKLHLYIALLIVLPSVVVIASGILLQVKKQSDWVQPPTVKGEGREPTLPFETVFKIVTTIEPLEVSAWHHIDRIDVRPDKGVLKVQAVNHWEAQLDAQTGKILQVAYRRSNTIESIHDGSWFADFAKLWIFLPAAILLLLMWLSGVVLLYTTLKSKRNKKRYRKPV